MRCERNAQSSFKSLSTHAACRSSRAFTPSSLFACHLPRSFLAASRLAVFREDNCLLLLPGRAHAGESDAHCGQQTAALLGCDAHHGRGLVSGTITRKDSLPPCSNAASDRMRGWPFSMSSFGISRRWKVWSLPPSQRIEKSWTREWFDGRHVMPSGESNNNKLRP